MSPLHDILQNGRLLTNYCFVLYSTTPLFELFNMDVCMPPMFIHTGPSVSNDAHNVHEKYIFDTSNGFVSLVKPLHSNAWHTVQKCIQESQLMCRRGAPYHGMMHTPRTSFTSKLRPHGKIHTIHGSQCCWVRRLH